MTAHTLAEQRNFSGAVIELVREKGGGVSFVEIEDLLSPFMTVQGERSLALPDHANIILWMNMSETVSHLIEELVNNKVLVYSPVEWLVYLIDRKLPTLPLATEARSYDTPHWLPVAFNPGEQFPREDHNPNPHS